MLHSSGMASAWGAAGMNVCSRLYSNSSRSQYSRTMDGASASATSAALALPTRSAAESCARSQDAALAKWCPLLDSSTGSVPNTLTPGVRRWYLAGRRDGWSITAGIRDVHSTLLPS